MRTIFQEMSGNQEKIQEVLKMIKVGINPQVYLWVVQAFVTNSLQRFTSEVAKNLGRDHNN